MSNRCHPPCFSTQIFRGSLLTRPQTKGRGRVVPQNRHFPLNLSSTCSSTCTISVPPRVHSIFHLPRVHSFSYAQPRTTHQFNQNTDDGDDTLGDVKSSSNIGSGNSSSCNTLPPSLPYFSHEVFTAPITRQRQWRQRT